MANPKPVVIDTDPGLDDALALILALRSPAVDVRAITVVAGNVPLPVGTPNVLRILEVLDPDHVPPVHEGCDRSLSPPVARAEHVHGTDGLGGISKSFPVRRLKPKPGHASQVLVDLARRHGRDLTIVALGPLTNIAGALSRDARAMAGIGRLVVMGGSADSRGNATPMAEFNFYSDPCAASRILRSGLPVTLVGLNVTERTLLPRIRFREALGGLRPGRLREFLGQVATHYFDFCRKEHGADACAMHDPLAIGVAIDRGCIRTDTMRCDVVSDQGMTRGQTLVGDGRVGSGVPPVQVAIDVDAERFLRLFLGTACGP